MFLSTSFKKIINLCWKLILLDIYLNKLTLASPLLVLKLGQLMQQTAICNANVDAGVDSDFAVCGAAIMSRFKANFLATQWTGTCTMGVCVCVCVRGCVQRSKYWYVVRRGCVCVWVGVWAHATLLYAHSLSCCCCFLCMRNARVANVIPLYYVYATYTAQRVN